MRTGTRALGILLLTTTWTWAENWPHWRGPGRDGVSPGEELARVVERDGKCRLEGSHAGLERGHADYLG